MPPRDSAAVALADPVLLAIARAPVEPWTAEEAHAVEEARREGAPVVAHGELGPRLCAHFGVTADQWADDDVDPVDPAAVIRWLETGEGDPCANAPKLTIPAELAGLPDDPARPLDLDAFERWAATGEDDDAIVFEGTAEEAIRFLEGPHADDTIAVLRSEGLLCASSG